MNAVPIFIESAMKPIRGDIKATNIVFIGEPANPFYNLNQLSIQFLNLTFNIHCLSGPKDGVETSGELSVPVIPD